MSEVNGKSRKPLLLLIAVVIALLAAIAMRLFGPQSAGGIFIGQAEAREEKKPERIKHTDLPKGHKLVNVATQCFSGGFCEPWWLLQSSNDPSFFIYTNGEKEYSFTENK